MPEVKQWKIGKGITIFEVPKDPPIKHFRFTLSEPPHRFVRYCDKKPGNFTRIVEEVTCKNCLKKMGY